MAEEKRDTLAVMSPPAGLGECGADVDRLELVALVLLAAMGHRVGDDDSAQTATVERLDSVAAKNAVRDDGHHLTRAVLHDRVGGLDQRATGVGHVVDQDGDSVLDVAHQHHAGDFVRTRPLLMDQGEAQVEAVGDGGGSRKPSKSAIYIICPSDTTGARTSCLERRPAYLFAPPASGLTITALATSRFSRIHRRALGSAYKLSTGTLKKP